MISAFPLGGKVAPQSRMRGESPAATHSRAVTASLPLIRLRSEPQTPSPLGEGILFPFCYDFFAAS